LDDKTTSDAQTGLDEDIDFSLVVGGPLFQLLMKARLLSPPLGLVHRRIAAFVVVTWLPLAILTLTAGTFKGGAAVSFLADLDVHVRLLVSLPLLVLAELFVHEHLRPTVAQFLVRKLVLPEQRSKFDSAVALALRLRHSILAEVVILLLAFAWHLIWRWQGALQVATWYEVPAEGSMHYTVAGYWYAFISLSIVRFLLLRWYFRIMIWYIFLWKVSRLRLRLNPLHPDRAAGLTFLNEALLAMMPVLVAQSAMIAGIIGTRIMYAGAKLPEFRYEIIGFILFLVLFALAPLMFFSMQLAKAKRRGHRVFGAFAEHYVDQFAGKWLHKDKAAGEELLGTGDIQSLADLGNSYQVVREMRAVPFDKGVVISLIVAIALPMLPLVLTMFPFEEIVRRLASMVF
jgi:hypothetical protein